MAWIWNLKRRQYIQICLPPMTFDLNSGSTNSPDNGNNVALFVMSIWGQCSITVLLLWLVWCAVLKSPHRTHPDTQPCRHIRTTASIRFVNDVYSLSHTLSWFYFCLVWCDNNFIIQQPSYSQQSTYSIANAYFLTMWAFLQGKNQPSNILHRSDM